MELYGETTCQAYKMLRMYNSEYLAGVTYLNTNPLGRCLFRAKQTEMLALIRSATMEVVNLTVFCLLSSEVLPVLEREVHQIGG
jgi:hypothetical protein